jgi:sulfite exporter TauE/SafE
MLSSLVVSAALMGLAGGPHCLAMCGAACAGITSAAAGAGPGAMWGFQIGRLLGYSSLGALAAASMQGLGWLTLQSAAFRPLWSFFHVLLMLLGLWLVWRAEPPTWLGAWTQGIWRCIKPLGQRQAAHASFAAPFVLGLVWALLPCGLLYSAVMLASLSDGVLQGAQVMAAFALGGAGALSLLPWVLRRWKPGAAGLVAWGQGGVRLAGLGLAASSGTALWLGLLHNQAPWCVAP